MSPLQLGRARTGELSGRSGGSNSTLRLARKGSGTWPVASRWNGCQPVGAVQIEQLDA